MYIYVLLCVLNKDQSINHVYPVWPSGLTAKQTSVGSATSAVLPASVNCSLIDVIHSSLINLETLNYT